MLMGHACLLGALDATTKMAANLLTGDKVPRPEPSHRPTQYRQLDSPLAATISVIATGASRLFARTCTPKGLRSRSLIARAPAAPHAHCTLDAPARTAD